MNFRKLFKNRYFWIVVGLLLAGSMVASYFLFFNKNLQSPEGGTASFYEYPVVTIDSILEVMPEIDKSKTILAIGNINNQDKNFASLKNDYSGAFYIKFNTDSSLNTLSSIPNKANFINAVSERILPNYSNDSVLFTETALLNTISDLNIFERYYNYQIEILKSFNINGMLIPYEVQSLIDSTSVNSQTNKIVRKLKLLHENKFLSFIEIEEIPSFENDETKKLFYKSIQEIADSGLCGILFHRTTDINLINEIEFDGLSILSIENKETPSKNIIEKVDLFIINSQSFDKESFTETIKKESTKENLFHKTSKVLRAGYWANSFNDTTDTVSIDLNLKLLQSNLTESSITVLKNNENLIPFTNINQKIHFVFATDGKPETFLNSVIKYTSNYTQAFYNSETNVMPSVPNYANSLVVVYDNKNALDSIPSGLTELLETYNKNKVIINYGKIPVDLAEQNSHTIIQVYGNDELAMSFSAQLLFGGIAAKGELSSYLNDSLKIGFGIKTEKTRFKYSLPEDVGLNPDTLNNIDSLINLAMSSGAFPGCQVFIAKNGVVVFDKSYGYHSYSKSIDIKSSDMYDVASLTKICGTTLAMMKMVEKGKIRLDDEIGEYFENTEIDYGNIEPDTVIFIDTISIAGKTELEIIELVTNKDTIHLSDTLIEMTEIVISRVSPDLNIFKVPVRSLLVHQSGVNPSLPILPYMFYQDSYGKLLRDKRDKADTLPQSDSIQVDTTIVYTRQEAYDCYYSSRWIEDSAEIKIADGMYFRQRWFDTLYTEVKRLGVYPYKIYQYTDMNMILAQMTIDSVNDKPINEYLHEEFYYDLGLKNTSYKPLNDIPRYRIPPTETETFWRKQSIRGYVHDPSAAMLGGVSGNAGLFSSASDLGIIGQMWLNRGAYGGLRYLNPGTVNMFTARQPENHRGLGFDKAAIKNLNAKSAPSSTYGHTGFTGCVMWVDPENEIVYVFLSNRLHPDVNNWKILGLKTLQEVHQVIYNAMEE